jgi:hypothetical protein
MKQIHLIAAVCTTLATGDLTDMVLFTLKVVLLKVDAGADAFSC